MKKEKVIEKKEKLKRKLARIKKKIAAAIGKKTPALAALAFLFPLAGCQSADPATRSGAATYGDIIMMDCTNCSLTIGDGAILDASGGGDNNSNTPTQTTTPTTELSYGGGDGITSLITGTIKAARNAGNTGSKSATASAANCTDGSCIPTAPTTE